VHPDKLLLFCAIHIFGFCAFAETGKSEVGIRKATIKKIIARAFFMRFELYPPLIELLPIKVLEGLQATGLFGIRCTYLGIGTDLVRPRERLSGNWGIGRTLDAELE
jgi:hypothetical protein